MIFKNRLIFTIILFVIFMNRIILLLILIGIGIYLYNTMYRSDNYNNIISPYKSNKLPKQNNRHVRFSPKEIILGPTEKTYINYNREEKNLQQHHQHLQQQQQQMQHQQQQQQQQQMQQMQQQQQMQKHQQQQQQQVQKHQQQQQQHVQQQQPNQSQWSDTYDNSHQLPNVNDNLINTDTFIDDIFIKPAEIDNTNLTLSENEYFNY